MQQEVEKIIPLVNSPKLPEFDIFRRFRFQSDSKRLYFRKGRDFFYSGVTGAVKRSGLVDMSGLDKARLKMAFEGVDADEEWGQKRDYGTVFHTIVSKHESPKTDSGYREFVFDSGTTEGEAWRKDVITWATEYGCPHLAYQWIDQVQNDMFAWFRFKKDKNVEVMASEICVASDEFKICTPLDIVCEMDFGKKRILADINIKTGTHGREGKDYTLQLAVEEYLWNKTMEDKGRTDLNLGGTFLWHPKDRLRAPADYNLSKNYSKVHSDREIFRVMDSVELCGLNRPTGTIREYSGNEGEFAVKVITPQEFLKNFNEDHFNN